MLEKRLLKTGVSWRVRWHQSDGAERSRSFKTKREAEHFEREVQFSKSNGTYVDPARGRITVAQLWPLYLASRSNVLKEKTLAGYAFEYSARIEPRWSDTKLNAIAWEQVQEWTDDMGEHVGASSVRYAHRVFTLILEFAVKTNRLHVNPGRQVVLPSLTRKPPVFLSVDQVERLADECSTVSKVYGDAVRSFAYLGLRSGELLELRTKDINLDRKRISISRNATSVRGKYIIGTPKTKASHRQVPIPDVLMGIIKARVQSRGPDELIFSSPTDRSKIMRIENMRRDTSWKTLTQSLGFPGLTIHGLRHSYASLMRRAGADMQMISKLMGHSTITVTASVYSHLFDDESDVVADLLSKHVRDSFTPEMKAS